MPATDKAQAFDPAWARVLRDAAPYLLAHHDSTAVVVMPGMLLEQPQLHSWLGDITLLQRIARLRFAIAFDTLPQAAKIAADAGVAVSALRNGKVSVSDEQMTYLRKAAHETRDHLEGCLAHGAPGHLAGVGTATGNLLSARLAGTVNGTDLGLMGITKTIPAATARALIGTGKIVLLPPLGITSDSRFVHLDATDVALEFAASSSADKLIMLVPSADFVALGFRELTLAEAKQSLKAGRFASNAAQLVATGVAALSRGVGRVHILNAELAGSLLVELLSPDGVAAMISVDRFDAVRKADIKDAAGIFELIAPSVAAGIMLNRELHEIVENIDSFAVVARDDALVACGCLHRYNNCAELGCLTVRPDYANQAYGKLLVEFFENAARQQDIAELFVVTTQTATWFTALGYRPDAGTLLPAQRLSDISMRHAQILSKQLSTAQS